MFTRIAPPIPSQVPTSLSAVSVRGSPASARRVISASRCSTSSDGSRTGSSSSVALCNSALRPTTVSQQPVRPQPQTRPSGATGMCPTSPLYPCPPRSRCPFRSEEHTSELQSHHDLVCRLLLEKKNNQSINIQKKKTKKKKNKKKKNQIKK